MLQEQEDKNMPVYDLLRNYVELENRKNALEEKIVCE